VTSPRLRLICRAVGTVKGVYVLGVGVAGGMALAVKRAKG
jgi:hypothetical protein